MVENKQKKPFAQILNDMFHQLLNIDNDIWPYEIKTLIVVLS